MRKPLIPLMVAVTAVLAVACLASLFVPPGPLFPFAIIGSAAAAYMAINVGANDVANNMGPAVGAKALKMSTALLIAAVLDLAGALLAGHSVIETVSQELLSLDPDQSGKVLVLAMIAATLSAALLVNASTLIGAPVSTTHAIVGGVVGAGTATGGIAAVQWHSVAVIAFSWTLSPLLGGLLAAGLHTIIRKLITRRPDKVRAAKRWLPVLIGIMASIFALYLDMVFRRPSSAWPNLAIGLGSGLFTYLLAVPWVRRRSSNLENRKKQVARLFRPPLIAAAALLCFAHGTNDVANAVAPLIVILPLVQASAGAGMDPVPFWVMIIGATGIATGILCFGPRVIHTIGEKITKLNEIRAFCVAFAAAITVLAASVLGLPISSTHVAVGAVFGVGFLREYLAIRNMHGAAVPVAAEEIDPTSLNDTPQQAVARERRSNRRYLVRRFNVVRIAAAWLITMPASALVAAIIFAAASFAFGPSSA